MCETRTLLVPLSIILRVATSFRMYQAHTEKKVGHESKIKKQAPCKNEYKMYCLNGGQCHYLVDKGLVGCIW